MCIDKDCDFLAWKNVNEVQGGIVIPYINNATGITENKMESLEMKSFGNEMVHAVLC